jgi:hypothetical protein
MPFAIYQMSAMGSVLECCIQPGRQLPPVVKESLERRSIAHSVSICGKLRPVPEAGRPSGGERGGCGLATEPGPGAIRGCVP